MSNHQKRKGIFSFFLFSCCLPLVFPAFASTTFTHDRTQGQLSNGLGNSGGIHAVTSKKVNSQVVSSFGYNQNGDLIDADGQDALCHDYTVNRKLKRASSQTRSADQQPCTSGDVIRYFYTAAGEKVAVKHPTGNVEVFAQGNLRFTGSQPRYTYGGSAETRFNSSEIDFFLRDHLGSVVATIDHNGIIERKDKRPFGETWYARGAVGSTDRDFNGNLKEGQLLDYNARHYLPGIGKFIQTDSIIPKSDTVGFNRYAYVSNNPLNRIDPSGHGDIPHPEWSDPAWLDAQAQAGGYPREELLSLYDRVEQYQYDLADQAMDPNNNFLERANGFIGVFMMSPVKMAVGLFSSPTATGTALVTAGTGRTFNGRPSPARSPRRQELLPERTWTGRKVWEGEDPHGVHIIRDRRTGRIVAERTDEVHQGVHQRLAQREFDTWQDVEAGFVIRRQDGTFQMRFKSESVNGGNSRLGRPGYDGDYLSPETARSLAQQYANETGQAVWGTDMWYEPVFEAVPAP